MIKKKQLVLLVLLSFIWTLAACSDKETSEPGSQKLNDEALENFNEAGMPIVNEPITIEVMAGKYASNSDNYNELLVWKTYEDMTNIHINWTLVPFEGREEKRNLSLAGGTLPEVFYTMAMPNQDLLKYGEQGVFVTLNDLIEKYMPNLTALFEQYPEIKQGATFPDGNIYGLPTIRDPEFTSTILSSKGWIRQDWLEKLGLDMPETVDDFYNYLKAVKEADLNENGKNDEVPFGATDINGLRDILKGAFGVGNKGANHAYLDEDPDTGELRFYPISDDYKKLLTYLNKLYSEGFIQENIYSIDRNQSYGMGTEGLYGSTVSSSPITAYGDEMGNNFVGLPALEGPAGKQYNKVLTPLSQLGGFVITNENKNIPATLRWMDYFYSEEGAKLFFLGVEGETFEENENGDLQYLDKITNSPDGLTMAQEIANYFTWSGGGYPGLIMERTFKGAETLPATLEATEKLEANMLDEAWPIFTYTVEENNELSSIQSDIHKYVNEMQDKFITGNEPLSKWDQYIKRIETMNLEKYMEIQNDAYNRYKNS